jgi:hypothetical protein
MAAGIIRSVAGVAVIAAAAVGAGLSGSGAAEAACNPNTGCLPRPVSVQEVGGSLSYRYVVRPGSLDIVQTRSDHIYATGLHWSRWSGGYGVHGLFGGSAKGTGTLHATGSAPHRVTIYLWNVRSYGVNAFTAYEDLSIHGDSHVAGVWYWSNHTDRWVR